MSDGARPPKRDAARLQHGDGADLDLPADEHLDRMLGDQELLLRLQLSSYAPRDWLPVAAEFARYGLGVLEPWIGTGRIFGKVYDRTGFRLQPPPDDALDRDAANELAVDTVMASLTSFLENVLKKGGWDATRGASLKTFFIGKCLWEFPNVYKRWRRKAARWTGVVLDGDGKAVERAAGTTAGADAQVLREAAAAEALRLLSRDTARRAFVLQEMGYTHDEIAVEIGVVDAKAVENLLGYQRRRAQGRQERHERLADQEREAQ
jgi:hypothetical protein